MQLYLLLERINSYTTDKLELLHLAPQRDLGLLLHLGGLGVNWLPIGDQVCHPVVPFKNEGDAVGVAFDWPVHLPLLDVHLPLLDVHLYRTVA